MSTITSSFKMYWLCMLEPPWQHTGPNDDRAAHWVFWLIGWGWAIAGLALGALVGSSVVRIPELAGIPYQDPLLIGVCVLAGFLVQSLGWCMVCLLSAMLRTVLDIFAVVAMFAPLAGLFGAAKARRDAERDVKHMEFAAKVALNVFPVLFGLVILIPFAGVAYGIYRYIAWVGADHRSVTLAFAGGLAVKTLLIPFIKSIVSGAALKWVISKLRGDKTKAKGA